MRKILGLLMLCFVSISQGFALGEDFAYRTSTGTVFKNTHRNTPQDLIAASGAVFQNRHKNIPSQKPIASPVVNARGVSQDNLALIGSGVTKAWTGLISPAELAVIDRLSEYAVVRNPESTRGDPVRALSLVFLSMAVFFFCVELFTGRLYALSVSIVSVGMSLWILLMRDVTIGWWHAGGFVITLGLFTYVLPRTIRSYADDLGLLARKNEDPTS